MDYTDSITILTKMRKSQNKWHSRTLKNRAEKVLNQAHTAKHFVRVFDPSTADGIFDIIVSHFLE
jgi:peptide methionine sulfoxide reductase MsrB